MAGTLTSLVLTVLIAFLFSECECSKAGTIAGMNICNMITGQCMCKVDVTGRNCDRCKDGFYGLHKTNVYGCVGEFDTYTFTFIQ